MADLEQTFMISTASVSSKQHKEVGAVTEPTSLWCYGYIEKPASRNLRAYLLSPILEAVETIRTCTIAAISERSKNQNIMIVMVTVK